MPAIVAHRLSRWEPGVFIGLGTAEGKKVWLVYSPSINRLFASLDVQFDETLFPLCTHDQRVHGLYDYNVVQEMRANNQFVTLDEQAPAISKSDVWDPSIADAVLQQNYDVPISVVYAPAENAADAEAHYDSEAEVKVEDHAPPPTCAYNETEVPVSVVPPVMPSDQTSVLITLANKHCSTTGGKQVVKRHSNNAGTVTNPDTDSTDIQARVWEDVADEKINDINDFELGEYMVRTSAQLLLPADYYPRDKGPNKRQKGTMVELPVTHTSGSEDICTTSPFVKLCWRTSHSDRLKCLRISTSLAFVALAALQTMAWTATKAVLKDMESPLPAQPRLQRDARSRPDWEQWLRAEEVNMKMCFDKGTFTIVDLPPGTVELPSMFQYKLQTGPS
eukprot:532442-Rhodomonas_salina.5